MGAPQKVSDARWHRHDLLVRHADLRPRALLGPFTPLVQPSRHPLRHEIASKTKMQLRWLCTQMGLARQLLPPHWRPPWLLAKLPSRKPQMCLRSPFFLPHERRRHSDQLPPQAKGRDHRRHRHPVSASSPSSTSTDSCGSAAAILTSPHRRAKRKSWRCAKRQSMSLKRGAMNSATMMVRVQLRFSASRWTIWRTRPNARQG